MHVDGQYFYVGKTMTNAKTRWWEHRARARAGHGAPVYEYMRKVGVHNCDITVLDTDPVTEAYWIKRLLDQGHPIQNSLGRDGVPNSHSEESKRKIGEGNAGRRSWIAGRAGDAAGWTDERRIAQSERITGINKARKA